MSITDELRKSFDQCTYKAGVAPDEFDTVWITKSCALSMLDDIDAAFEAGHSRAVEYGKKIGRGTCHKVLDFDGTAWICSECGEHIGPRRWNYCPNCGRRIEVDE